MSCRARGCLAVSEWRSKIGLEFSVCSSAKLPASVGGLWWAQGLQKSVNVKGAVQQGQKVPLFLAAWLWGARGSPWEDAWSPSSGFFCAQRWLCPCSTVPSGSATPSSASVPSPEAHAASSEPYSRISQSQARCGCPHLWSACFHLLCLSRPRLLAFLCCFCKDHSLPSCSSLRLFLLALLCLWAFSAFADAPAGWPRSSAPAVSCSKLMGLLWQCA